MQNLYEILGIEKTATKKEIKKSYLKLAKLHHPDKGGDPMEFKKINDAYMILSNDKLRNHYDETGQIPKNNNDKIISELMQLFFHCIDSFGDNIIYKDLFTEMINILNLKNNEIKKAISQTESKIKNYQNTQNRIKGKNEIFKNAIENVIANHKANINNMNDLIILNDSMIDFIKENKFTFEFDKKEEKQDFNFMKFGTFSGRFGME